jgi:hypothetical protein
MARDGRGSATGETYKGGAKSPATSTKKERGAGAGRKSGAGKKPPKMAKSETGRGDRKPIH